MVTESFHEHREERLHIVQPQAILDSSTTATGQEDESPDAWNTAPAIADRYETELLSWSLLEDLAATLRHHNDDRSMNAITGFLQEEIPNSECKRIFIAYFIEDFLKLVANTPSKIVMQVKANAHERSDQWQGTRANYFCMLQGLRLLCCSGQLDFLNAPSRSLAQAIITSGEMGLETPQLPGKNDPRPLSERSIHSSIHRKFTHSSWQSDIVFA